MLATVAGRKHGNDREDGHYGAVEHEHYVNGSEIVGQEWMLMKAYKDRSEGSQTKKEED